RHGLLASLGPQHRRARSPVHRARPGSSVLWRLGDRRARGDRTCVFGPRASALRGDVPGRWAAAPGRILVRRRHRDEPRTEAWGARHAPLPGLARRLSITAVRRAADPEPPGGRPPPGALSPALPPPP